ncbi:MAG: hypothetical protein HOO96_17620 [Polyangiaceae bacterium]|nr:hypothetical protein [Polyangiaceae bacterium]
MTTKKRLTLMPEVLPSPEKIAGRPEPRARILARLKYLSALSMTSLAAAACLNDGYGVVDPIPSPSCTKPPLPTVAARYVSRNDGGADAAVDAGLTDAEALDAEASDAGADAQAADASTPSDGGAKAGEARLVEISLGFERETPNQYGQPVESDAPIVESSFFGSRARLVVSVPAGRSTVQLTLPLICDGTTGKLAVALELGEASVAVKTKLP